ncbi:hypothetical protein ACHAQH_002490 [Verticillium albo-atrum]
MSNHTADFADSVGHFANILPIRFQIDSGRSFKDLLNRTSHSVLSAFDNSQVPFDLLLERLGIERSPVHTPLFQVAFNYRVGDILQRLLGDCVLSMVQYIVIKAPYDLVINVTQTGSQCHLVECITSGDLYSKAATEFITETFIGLIESLTEDQSVRVRDCKLFSNEQVEHAVALGRGPTVTHPWPKTLSERFQQVVSAFSGSIAIKDSHESLNYSLMARRVGIYASSLLGANAGPSSRVAVLCQPCNDMYVTMLAILHIGAVYVPLDINLPDARRRSMMDACKPYVLVFHAATAEAAMKCSGDERMRALDLSKLQAHATSIDSVPTLASTSATQESFLLFTSGSTGTPKGIRLGQGGIMNYAASKSVMLGLGQVRVLQQTSSGFDMAIAQAFNAFANGGNLVIALSKARGDPGMISQIILEEGIEFTLATPSEYLMLTAYAADTLRKCTMWRHACSGSEVVLERLVSSLRRLELPMLSFTDCYGPTELSCATTFRNIPLSAGADKAVERKYPRDGAISIVGKAISNTSIYILSEDGKTALPTGMPGEICIGGRGVARGYLDARLSRDKFVPNPFATPEDSQGLDVMYNTGDKVVKLRGLRIDLNEVASAILPAAPKDSLAETIVTTRGEPQFLVAYVFVARGKSLDHGQLDTLLRDLELPRYMIPSRIVPLDHLPTSTNGKVDRAALNARSLPDTHGKEDERATLTVPEGELRVLWQKVLGEAAGAAIIAPYSDFFVVGGSSLLLVRLQNIFKEKMGVALSIQDLDQATTLRGMAAAMHQERGGEILAQVMKNNDVAKIHCVAVSDDERQKLASEHDGNGKMVIYAGSIMSPTLGLSGTERALLSSSIDQIIHAAVQGHCMINYTSVKQALHCALIGERAPADDVMNSVVRFSLMTRKVPNVAGAEGFFDFKDVVAVASEMEGENPAAKVPRLAAVYGGEFETVEPSEWLEAAAEYGMGEMLVIHLRANMESGKPMVFPYLGS